MTTATATRTRKPRPKPQRFVRLTRTSNPAWRALTIRVKHARSEQVYSYTVEELPRVPQGRGFLLTKETGESYAVHVAGQHSTCECRGFASHSHCKHVEALLALEAAGKL